MSNSILRTKQARTQDSALYHHLVYNHVPSIPSEWVPAARRAIDKAQARIDETCEKCGEARGSDWCPERVTFDDLRVRGPWGGLWPVTKLIEGMHLDGFLTWPEEEEEDLDDETE